MTARTIFAGPMLAAMMLAAILAAAPALAQTGSIARLTSVQGNVLVSQATAMSAAAAGQALPPGVRVITTAGAKATVTYNKGCEVRLDENQRYTVREQAECARASAPPLGATTGFAVLGAARVTSTGESVVRGELGTAPGTGITGFPPARILGGTVHPADDLATQAQKDLVVAYDDVVRQACNIRLTGQDLGGQTLTDGVYCFPASAARLNGELTLDGQGDITSLFIFQVGSLLQVADKATVKLVNGAQACNVYWQVGDSAMIGKEAKFVGTLLVMGGTGVGNEPPAASGATPEPNVNGRVLVRTGAVTLDKSRVEVPNCVLAGGGAVTQTGALLGLGALVGAGVGIYEVAKKPKSPN